MKLTTRYLGLELAHPFMPGASPLADTLDSVRQLEDAGASAIVMRSLFEEQILQERFGPVGIRVRPGLDISSSSGASRRACRFRSSRRSTARRRRGG